MNKAELNTSSALVGKLKARRKLIEVNIREAIREKVLTHTDRLLTNEEAAAILCAQQGHIASYHRCLPIGLRPIKGRDLNATARLSNSDERWYGGKLYWFAPVVFAAAIFRASGASVANSFRSVSYRNCVDQSLELSARKLAEKQDSTAFSVHVL